LFPCLTAKVRLPYSEAFGHAQRLPMTIPVERNPL